MNRTSLTRALPVLVFLTVLLPPPSVLRASENFVTIALPKGLSIDLPQNWVVLSQNQRITLDTAVESRLDLSGLPQEPSGLGFAANYYDDEQRTLGIVNVRYYPEMDLTQDDAVAASTQEIVELDLELEKAMRASGTPVASWRGTQKIVTNGISAFLTEYTRAANLGEGNFRVRLFRVFQGDRSFTLTVSYLESAVLLEPITARMLASIRLEGIGDAHASANPSANSAVVGTLRKMYGDNWPMAIALSAVLTWVLAWCRLCWFASSGCVARSRSEALSALQRSSGC